VIPRKLGTASRLHAREPRMPSAESRENLQCIMPMSMLAMEVQCRDKVPELGDFLIRPEQDALRWR
jgi:hypothetical protein